MAWSLAAAVLLVTALGACGSSTSYPAGDYGVRVTLTKGTGWTGSEQVDHVTLMATSPGRAPLFVCFGATNETTGAAPTLSTGNTIDPCADEPSLVFTAPPTIQNLLISTRQVTADLGFPEGAPVTVTAFIALAGSAIVGPPASSATMTVTAKAGFADVSLTLDNQIVAPTDACTRLTYIGTPVATASDTLCGAPDPACIASSDAAPNGLHDGRVHCLASGGAGFVVDGTVGSTCASPAVAWRNMQASTAGCDFQLELAFYACVDESVPTGAPDDSVADGGTGCLRTAACTRPSVTFTAVTGIRNGLDTTSLDVGACLPPSVFPLSFTLPGALGASVDLSVTPSPASGGLPPCDVEVDILQGAVCMNK